MGFIRKLKNNINLILFLFSGKKPWSRGYQIYKEKQIARIIDSGKFNTKWLKEDYGFRLDERVIEYPWLFSQLPEGSGRLLDAGSALNFDFLLSREPLRSKKLFISTLAPENTCFWEKGVSYIYEDLRDACYKDVFFDWVVSISTIEHIGLDNTMLYTSDESKNESTHDSYLEAIREYYRVLKPGGVLYLTFPFGKHVNHGWFQVFDRDMLDNLIDVFSPTSAKEFHFRYEPNGWKISSRKHSCNATYFDIHKQKTYDKDFAAASRSVACLKLQK
jgi:SAM-dependent methyltransferase